MDNEEENEFLAVVDLVNVNVTDKVDTATVEKADRSTELNKHRFVNKSYNAHPSSYLLEACSYTLSSALNERPQPSLSPAIITSSESPHAGVLHSLNAQKFFRIPAASNEQFVFDSHVGNS